MRRRTHGSLRECAFGILFALREVFVIQESSRAERADQVLLQLSDLKIAGEADQMRAQVKLAAHAVEKFQAFHQRGRNDQHGV